MSRTRAMLYAVFAAVVGALAFWLGVGSTLGQKAEASVLDASAFTTNPPAPLGLVSTLSVSITFIVLVVIALIVHGFGRAVTIFFFGAAAILASQFLKESLLERPQFLELDEINTFPSGHMTIFGVLSGALIWAAPKSTRWLFSLISTVVLAIVAWQLLEFGWHRPSDLIGAQALVVLAYALASWIGFRKSRRAEPSAVFGAVNKFTSIALTLTGIIVVLGGFALVGVAASTHSDQLMLNAGEIVLVGVSVLTTRTLARLAP